MHQKMITLCDETLQVAKNMPNFSSWVRGKLREHMMIDRPPKEFMHCDEFVTATWSKLGNCYWARCLVCNEVLEWRK